MGSAATCPRPFAFGGGSSDAIRAFLLSRLSREKLDTISEDSATLNTHVGLSSGTRFLVRASRALTASASAASKVCSVAYTSERGRLPEISGVSAISTNWATRSQKKRAGKAVEKL